MLLRKVVVQNPYSLNESRHAWTRISEEMNAALQDEGFEVDYRRCRERTSLLLHYYKRQNFAGLRRWGTESLYMEKEHLLDQVMALESGKSLPMTPETSYKDSSDEALAVTITEETLRKVQEEGLWQQSVQEAKEEAEYSDSEAPLPKRVCQGCCQTYSELLLLQERRAQVEQRLREDELAVRREELQIEKEKLALERERLDAERRERERRFELESQERQMILDILKEKMMRK